MFYSQIILAKKGPLGQVWQAAHWGAKKLGRPAVFSTDIASITTSIANPTVPMALRVSGHLLLGIVRIYSRQVQFLLDDCHQAMIKVKMAYSSSGTSGSNGSGGTMIDITVTTRGPGGSTNAQKGSGSTNNALNISNFGEYHDGTTATGAKGDIDDYYNSMNNMTTTHFAIPLEELLQRASDVSGMEHTEDDWVPAELDDSTLHLSSNLMNLSATTGMADTSILQHSGVADAEWGVFDPNDGEGEDTDDDDEEDEIEGKKIKKDGQDDGSASQVSDIEITRAVNESTISDPSRRASMIESNLSGNVSDKGGDSSVDANDFPVNLDDDDQNMMMYSDDDNDSELARRRRTSLRLNNSNESDKNEMGISFASPESTGNTESNVIVEATTATKSRRPRKRRKIITDDGRTELTNDHIRSMLADTSDVCRTNLLHPATWIEPSGNEKVARNDEYGMIYDYSDIDKKRNRNRFMLWNSFAPQSERLFTRPKIGDDGCLSSELLDLWSRNCAPVLNQPFRYDLIAENDIVEGNKDNNKQKVDEDQDESDTSDVEEARNAHANNDFGDNMLPEDGTDPTLEHDINNSDDNNAIPFNDEDDQMPIPEDDHHDSFMPPDSPAARSQASMESIFSLGATNDIDNALVDFDGSTADGDNEYDGSTTTTSKWHKNTIKVFEVLKKNIISPHGNDDDEDTDINNTKKEFVSYNTLSEGVTRRTAAGFFFELLQLKSLNYIELNQPESYGDITISAGVEFHENPPLE